MAFLYLAPLVTSTVSLWFAFDQFFFLGVFLHEKVKPHAKNVLTPYWNTMIDTGLLVIAPLLGTMVFTATIITRTSEEVLRNKGSYSWYIASILLAAGHFSFVPIALPKIRRLQSGGLTPTLRQWMRVHVARTLSVDLFCWITCLVACAKTLSVGF